MLTVLGIVILYCLTGVLFLLTYILAMQPAKQETVLGLIVLFWPAVIAIELTLAVASQFGRVGAALAAKMRTSARIDTAA